MSDSFDYMKEKSDKHIQQQIKITVVTWNLEGMVPPVMSVNKLMNKILGNLFQLPDIITISTQQCQRPLSEAFFYEKKEKWEALLCENLESKYTFVDSQTLQGLHSAIFIKKQLESCFTKEGKSTLRAGTCNLLGNKGAVSIKFNLLGQYFQFINCHLAPHQTESDHRNETLIRIMDTMAEKDEAFNIFLCGDLNYRIDMSKDQYKQLIKGKKNIEEEMHYEKMIDKDQLMNQQVLNQRFLINFEENKIKFPPTYKMSVNSSQYNPKRVPGWTDRIFRKKGKIRQQSYFCMYNLFGSDHRPVIGTFKVKTQECLSLFPEQFVAVTTEKCQLI